MRNYCCQPKFPSFIIVLFVFLIFSNPSIGQQPYIKQLAAIDDFGAGQIKCIYQDKQGFIWIGATSGAYRFDGQIFMELPIPDSLLNKSVTSVLEDSGHGLWFGFEDGNILKYDRFKVMIFKSKSELPASKITAIAEGENQSLWIGTYGEGIFVYQNNDVFKINSDSGLSDDYIYNLLAVDKGIVWAGTDNGINICSFENGRLTIRPLSVKEGLPDFIVRSLKKDDKGNIWIGMQDKGLCRYVLQQDKLEIPSGISNWNMGSINDMVILNGSLWITTDGNGLVEYNPGTGEINAIHHPAGLNLSRINSILTDREGNIWMISNKEVNFSLGRRLEYYNTIEDQNMSNIHAIMVDAEDILWFANDKGLYSYSIYHPIKADKLRYYPLSFPPGESKIMSLYRDPFGLIWMGTFGQGLIRLDPKTGRQITITEKDGLLNGNVLSIKGSDEDIWFATLGGAFRCDIDNRLADPDHKPEFVHYGQAEGLSNSFIYNLHISSAKNVWFATDGSGVFQHKNGKFINISDDSSFRNKVIYSVTTGIDGHVWMNVAKEGLYKYDGRKMIKVFNDEGHKNLSFSGIIANNKSELIIAYTGGLDVMNTNTGEVAHYEENAGLSEINPDPNTLSIDSKGDVWIGTDKGIIRYRSNENQIWKHPQARITTVQVYLEKTNHGLNHVFRHNQNHLSFGYSGLWFQYPDKVEFEIRLEGHDLDWIKTKNNNVIYSNLSPGKYTFKVKAAIYGNFDVATEDSYSFTINRPFWMKIWFFILLTILIILAAHYYIKTREKRLKRKQELLNEKIRFQFENLKSQINPHFLFNSFSTLIALIDQNQDTAIEYVEELSNLFRSLLEYKDQDMITLKEELSIVDNYYKLQKKRYGGNLELKISIEDSEEKIMVPPLTLQLLIENALKHNVVSKDHPLKINIFADHISAYLFVENNLNEKKEPANSTGIGIRNIIDRYHLLTDKKIQIIKTESSFTVGLPFIYQK